jgi:prepilin-type N-terminal cleavage/methylation domain-containing protein
MKPREKGFVLTELLVATSIMALISFAACTVIFQVVQTTQRNSNHMTVLQVQNAGYWISRDAGMAQSVTADNLTLPDYLILSWMEQNSGDQYRVSYTLENMPEGSFSKMLRNQSINRGGNTTTLVALHIDSDPDKTNCEFTKGILDLTVTSTMSNGSSTRSETRTYQIAPRPGQ